MVTGQGSKARLRVDNTMENALLGGHLYPGTEGQLIWRRGFLKKK